MEELNIMKEPNIKATEVNPQKDFYREWQKTMIKGGNHDENEISEMSYINYVLNESNNKDDFDQALFILNNPFNNGRKNLIASVYIKMGDYEEAQRVIENVHDSSIYKEMIVCLKELGEKSPETSEKVMEYIKQHNSDYFDKLNSN